MRSRGPRSACLLLCDRSSASSSTPSSDLDFKQSGTLRIRATGKRKRPEAGEGRKEEERILAAPAPSAPPSNDSGFHEGLFNACGELLSSGMGTCRVPSRQSRLPFDTKTICYQEKTKRNDEHPGGYCCRARESTQHNWLASAQKTSTAARYVVPLSVAP